MSKLAVIFPGQGSQSLGMLGEHASHPATQVIFKRASDALGYDLLALVQNGPAEKLNETQYTQPALLATSLAYWEQLDSTQKNNVAFLAGHSLGEYSALVAANAISFEDGIKLVAKRGELMQQAVPNGKGAMAAILGLDNAQVKQACQQAAKDQVLEAVNFNAPGQVVIAGDAEAVVRGIAAAKALGARRALELPVSVPSHCALMRGAAEALAAYLQTVEMQSPTMPVVNNVDVKVEQTPEKIKDALVRQLYNPVRWVEVIEFMVDNDTSDFIECGPGKVLTGLNKRIIKERA